MELTTFHNSYVMGHCVYRNHVTRGISFNLGVSGMCYLCVSAKKNITWIDKKNQELNNEPSYHWHTASVSCKVPKLIAGKLVFICFDTVDDKFLWMMAGYIMTVYIRSYIQSIRRITQSHWKRTVEDLAELVNFCWAYSVSGYLGFNLFSRLPLYIIWGSLVTAGQFIR